MTNHEFSVNLFLEYIDCNICTKNDFIIIQDSKYSEIRSKEQLATVYNSSSGHFLFDQLVKCKSCSLVYLNPRISKQFALHGYQHAIDSRHHEQDHFRATSFYRALNQVGTYLSGVVADGTSLRLVDVGCASGIFVKVAQDLGFQAFGLEPSKYLARFGREKYGVKILPSTLEEFISHNQTEKVDLITFWDVLEHLSDPKATLMATKSLLNEEGYLILNLPMIDTFPCRVLRSKWPFFLNVHTFYFTKKTITKLLDMCGFEIVNFRRYWQTLGFTYVVERAGFKFFTKFPVLSRIPIRYYLGQRTIIARRRKV